MPAAAKIEARDQVQLLELARIRESKFNPRKTFTGLDELAADVAVHGVMQPILVRTIGAPAAGFLFEVVFGARRFRAAKMAKLETIKAFVQELTDAEALERMVVENCQRVDVDPLEEADGYRALHEEHKLTAEQIAEKVGKKRAHVYARIQLAKGLFPKVRAIIEKYNLGSERALLLARIPQENLQLEAAERIRSVHEDWETKESVPMGVRQATRYVKEHFMLQLAGAPFDTKDAELVKAAGPCTTCPFRTKNAPDLFDDIGKGDLCTKPSCFAEKKAASWAAERKEHKEKGIKVLTEEQARETFDPYGQGVRSDADYIRTRDQCPLDPKRRTWGQLMGKEAPKPTVVGRDRDDRVIPLIPKAIAVQILEDRGHKFVTEALAQQGPRAVRNDSFERHQAAQKRERETKLKVAYAAMGKVVEKWEAREPDKKFWLLLAREVADDCDFELFERRGWADADGNIPDLNDRLSKLSEAQLRGLVFELVLGPSTYSTWGDAHVLKDVCELYGVDLAKTKQELREQELAATKAARDEAKAKDQERKAAEKKTAAGAKVTKPNASTRVVTLRGKPMKIVDVRPGETEEEALDRADHANERPDATGGEAR